MGENITSFFLLAFRKVVHPPLQYRSLRRKFRFSCRHHLDWISLRHSVINQIKCFAGLRWQACDRVNLRPAILAISTGSVGEQLASPKQRVDGMTGGTPGRRGAMAHGLAVFLLAGIRREVVRVGVAGLF